MNIYRYIFPGVALLVALPLFSQVTSAGGAPKPPVQQASQSHDASENKQRDGNDVFAANCSRCHNAPEFFSPRVSGTIVRHMRVRAGLSKEDEQAILRFLNP
jgi:cytochrome c5